MPELPEVETIARALRRHLVGRTITGVRVFIAKLREPLDRRALRRVVGARVVAVHRRAKFLFVEVGNGRALILHFGMSGSCRICPGAEPRRKHEHVVWTLDDGSTWRFDDPRRFGMVAARAVERPGCLPPGFDHLPPEPLESGFDADYLRALCKGRKRAIKTLLMDHTLVAGVGNIYAGESLFRAGIRPGRAAGRLTRAECARLVDAVREVLRIAIGAGGTTLTDFRSVDGEEGSFQLQLFVYGRGGAPCRVCGASIRHTVLGGRSTFYCPRCQR